MSKQSVVAGVKRDLEKLKKRVPEIADSALAASALAIAAQLDDPEISATGAASCARALLDTMEKLNELAPGAERRSRLDELGARRAARRSGSA